MSKEEELCAITRIPLKEIESVFTLPCLHKFEETAIREFLSRKGYCPVCKMVVDLDAFGIIAVGQTKSDEEDSNLSSHEDNDDENPNFNSYDLRPRSQPTICADELNTMEDVDYSNRGIQEYAQICGEVPPILYSIKNDIKLEEEERSEEEESEGSLKDFIDDSESLHPNFYDSNDDDYKDDECEDETD